MSAGVLTRVTGCLAILCRRIDLRLWIWKHIHLCILSSPVANSVGIEPTPICPATALLLEGLQSTPEMVPSKTMAALL